jgi:hypothetical protein
MKYIIITIVLTILQQLSCFGQTTISDNSSPFQVLYATETTNKEGQYLKSLDMVSIDEVLSIGKGGTLSLIHYSGFPIEINKDTSVTIRKLQEILEVPEESRKVKGKIVYPTRPEIGRLFGSDRKSRRGNAVMSACHDCDLGLRIIYPPKNNKRRIRFEDQLCLKWKSNSENYKIRITNIFEELIDSLSVHNSELVLSSETLAKLFEKDDILLLKIEDIKNPMLSGTVTLSKYSSTPLDFPYPCELTKATFALMTAFYLEMKPWDALDEAEKYYTLATELSKENFYIEILEKFKESRER